MNQMEYDGGDLLKKEVNIKQFNLNEVIRIITEMIEQEIFRTNIVEDGEKDEKQQ